MLDTEPDACYNPIMSHMLNPELDPCYNSNKYKIRNNTDSDAGP